MKIYLPRPSFKPELYAFCTLCAYPRETCYYDLADKDELETGVVIMHLL